MKQLQLKSLHQEAGAKFGEFAGYEMPLFYPLGVMQEHLHTRAKAGLFDISHMAHVEVSGPAAAATISRACPYDAASQSIGSGKYTFFLNDRGGIEDDLIITRLGEERYHVVANAGCAQKDIDHIQKVASETGATVKVLPRVFLALQGPGSERTLAALGLPAADMPFMTALEPKAGWFLSRSGYTGEDGFEIAVPSEDGEELARSLLANDDVEWIGLAARDSLRLEAGLPLYGQDLSDTITPHEAGLLWAIPKPLREGGGFIGADAIANAIAAGRKRKRIGLKGIERTPVRPGAGLMKPDGTPIGQVTSGGFGPSAGAPVAFGLVDAGFDGDIVHADVRGKQVPMAVTALPFVPHQYKR